MLPLSPLDNYDDETDDWSSPEGRRRFQYKMSVDTWQFYLVSSSFNPHPYCLISRFGPSAPLDEELEAVANERALFGTFMDVLDKDDLDLWDRFAQLLLSPVRRRDGSLYASNPDFVTRVLHHASLYRLGERPYPAVWRERIAQYLTSRWPEYKGRYVNAALLEEWDDWTVKRDAENFKGARPSLRARLSIEWLYQKHLGREMLGMAMNDFKDLKKFIKDYWKAWRKD